MQKEDIKIRNQFGAENHFQVPKGYFDNLAASVMQHIPDGQAKIVKMQTPAWRRHIVAISAAAASVAAAVCLVFALESNPARSPSHLAAQHATMQQDNSNIDAMVNYTMIDNDDMYAYMSGIE